MFIFVVVRCNSVRSTQERRDARRQLKTLAKTETVSEEEQARKQAELELKEQEDLLHSQLCDTSQVTLLLIINVCVCVCFFFFFILRRMGKLVIPCCAAVAVLPLPLLVGENSTCQPRRVGMRASTYGPEDYRYA